MNLALGATNAVLFFVYARAVLGRTLAALALAGAFVLNPGFLHAAVSELPSQAVTLYFFAGVVACAAIDARLFAPLDPARGERARVPWAGLALLALLTAILAFVRLEIAGLGLAALAVALLRTAARTTALGRLRIVRAFSSATPWSGWTGRQRLLAAVAALLVAAAAVAALAWLGRRPFPSGPAAWFYYGLNPLTPQLRGAVPMIADVASPGLLGLMAIGAVCALRHPARSFLLPVALGGLFGIYFVASHRAFYEVFRYLTLVLPVGCYLAPIGWRALEGACRRLPRPAVARALVGVAVVVLALVPPPIARALRPGVLIDRDQQREVRYLVELLDRFPDCVLVARTERALSTFNVEGSPDASRDLVLFGHARAWPETVPDDGRPLATALAQRTVGARCVLFYRDLDCNLAAGDRCAPSLQGLAPVDERRFDSRPYSDAGEYGPIAPTVELGVYRLF
jgi:hypothetical protein